MAFKTSFFLFCCFLLFTNQVYANNCPPQASAPVPSVSTPPQSPTPPQAPTTPPTHAPPQTPATPPVVHAPPPHSPSSPPMTPTTPPAYAPPQTPATPPVYAPPQSPTSPPTPESPTTYPPLPVTPSPPHKHGFCVVECMKRCKTLPAYTGKTRVCVRLCSHCCKANNKCVPGPATTCPAWDTIVYHGITVKCP